MKAKLLVSTAFLAASVSLSAQKSATITVHADQGKEIIPKEIYGQFAEHLGSCLIHLQVSIFRVQAFTRIDIGSIL